jgi:hypothetical protein
MLEAIVFLADPMVNKPLLPTNDLFCAAVEGGRYQIMLFSHYPQNDEKLICLRLSSKENNFTVRPGRFRSEVSSAACLTGMPSISTGRFSGFSIHVPPPPRHGLN